MGIVIAALTGCQGGPSSPLAPSAAPPASAAQAAAAEAATWGGTSVARTMAASQSSMFDCALGPFGLAERSHYTVSPVGTESLVCSGSVSASPPEGGAALLTDFPCTLPSGTVTLRSTFVFTPSGHATLTCQSK